MVSHCHRRVLFVTIINTLVCLPKGQRQLPLRRWLAPVGLQWVRLWSNEVECPLTHRPRKELCLVQCHKWRICAAIQGFSTFDIQGVNVMTLTGGAKPGNGGNDLSPPCLGISLVPAA